MSDSNFKEEGKPKLPTFLNVLTILTFVWSAYEIYTHIRNFTNGAKSLADLQKAQGQMENAPAWAKKFAGPEMVELLQKSIDNRVPLIIINLIAVSLCVFGAIEMRKLKKQGYWLWLFGELLPYIGTAIFIGGAFFNSFLALFMIFPIIFIILYTTQRKNLVY
jgi:hypothetical protein